MSRGFFTTGEVAAQLGIKRYRLDYLVTNGILLDADRVGNRRQWTLEQVDEMREQLERYEESRSHGKATTRRTI